MIPLEELAEKWFKIFSLMTVQNTVFLAIGLPLLLLLKRVSPRLRTIIMIAILIKMLIPPLPLPSLFQHHITSPLQMLDGVFSTATLTDSSSNSHHFSIPTFLFIIWSGVGSMIIILNIYHLLRYYHIARSGIPLKRDSEIKTSDSYSVVSAEKCSTPYIIGFFRPQIVLPAMMRDWKDSDLNIILAHEKAHWKFKDPWINVLQVVVQSFYFFHPLVWLLIREMNYLRELAS
ncbi:MAG: M56 family metallopeptidase, partial [Calditrichaeota bacterium]